MTNLTIENLYTDFKSAPDYSSEYASAFFEKYQSCFIGINSLKDKNEVNLYIELSWQQLQILFDKNKFAETLTLSSACLKIIDNEINRLNFGSAKNDWYYGLLLIKGMASYRVGIYKISTPIFHQLIQYNEKNENFKLWFTHSIYQQKKRIAKTTTILCALLLLIEIIFRNQITSDPLKIFMLVLALVGTFSTVNYDHYIKRKYKIKSPEQ